MSLAYSIRNAHILNEHLMSSKNNSQITGVKRSIRSSELASFYDRLKEDDTYLIYNVIFDNIKFYDELCEITFQNCLLDANKNIEPTDYKVSKTCYPILKGKFCLHKKNLVNNDCSYHSIHDYLKRYTNFLNQNLDSCSYRFPNKFNLTALSPKSTNLQVNSSFSLSNSFLLNIYSILIFLFSK